ncbi:HAD-superfamily hydrolase [Ascobolus immersus RN42]|uniref:HAD-superfamily hydrolase n=1 Tax=Ascobolus immersus RN42 TaxID=1160509 RepID=A0A3N4ICC3_ASCIM|nr:HAD-superfamily hydrolase [Ascobolus immersus RN42]
MQARLSPVKTISRVIAGSRSFVTASSSSLRHHHHATNSLRPARALKLSSRPITASLSSHGPRSFHTSTKLGLIRDDQKDGVKEKKDHPFAFAFDIDGVLLLGQQAYPTARRALELLNRHNVHYIFLTNGGGKFEHERVSQLSEKLSLPFSPAQIVLSHTPFRTFAPPSPFPPLLPEIGKIPGTVLVLGGSADKARSVALHYGFDNVVTSKDFLVASPTLWPFATVNNDVRKLAKPLPTGTGPSGELQINAIFIYNDPRDWGLDIQLIVDLLLSHRGYVGTRSPLNGVSTAGRAFQNDGQPTLFFGCDDLLWANEYHLPRLGQGAFKKALEGVWREVTGGAELQSITIGKPFPETYKFAEGVLSHWRNKGEEGTMTGKREELKRVYMVGDNPASDIAGANGYKSEEGTEWVGCLVKSGVYKGGEPEHVPRVVVEDVLEAVRWALEREGVRVEEE